MDENKNYNPYYGGQMPGDITEISFKDHLIQSLDCFWDMYQAAECTSGSGTWMDDFLFKRNVTTQDRLFIKRKELTRGNVIIKEVTGNENYENAQASTPGHFIYLPEINPHTFTATIVVTDKYKKWKNAAVFQEAVDFIQETITNVLEEWDRFMTNSLFDMLNYGEFDNTKTALWVDGKVPNTPVAGLSTASQSQKDRALFGSHNYGTKSVKNIFIASTAPTSAGTFVPYTTYDGVDVVAAPEESATYQTLKLVDLEQASREFLKLSSLDFHDGRQISCGCSAFYLYTNCFDFVERVKYSNPTGAVPVPSEGNYMRFEAVPGINVYQRTSMFIPSRTAYLVNDKHDMFYGEVMAPRVKYKNASDYVGNERKDYVEFEWDVMYGVFTPRGLMKIKF